MGTIATFDPRGLLSMQMAATALSGSEFRNAARRAVNWVGGRARTVVKRELARQTGLKPHVIDRALKVARANDADLSYVLTARGGEVRLKYFGPRETLKGVSAAPFGQRKIFESTFLKGGRFPERVPLKLGGQVYERYGEGRKIRVVRSGVWIPLEMIRGATPAAFVKTAEGLFSGRMLHEIDVIARGIVVRK